MQAYDIVQRSREENRWCASDYIELLISDFTEFHGDRRFGDDKAVIGGIGYLKDMPVTVIGIEKGHDLKERVDRNFGSAHPEGYRKALRLMKQAEKFHRPVLCIVDTAGAYAGVDAEDRGQGEAIAACLLECSNLRVPVVSVIIGEGGSGGALALCVADRLFMMDEAYFSVVSPENCATILWKSSKEAAKAAEALKLTADELEKLGIIDNVLETPVHGMDSQAMEEYGSELMELIYETYGELLKADTDELLDKRYERYRKIGRMENM